MRDADFDATRHAAGEPGQPGGHPHHGRRHDHGEHRHHRGFGREARRRHEAADHGRGGPGPWGFDGPWGGPWGRRRGGWGGWGGPPFGRGPRVGRGDVRAAALLLLAEQPMHGYQLIQELERRSSGLWRPSPGSVYPALQQLEDEGLVRATETEGKRVYHLTEEGQQYVREHAPELGAPWEAAGESVDEGLLELRDLVMQAGAAVMQVARAGSRDQVAAARQVLADTRRALYRILAEDGAGQDTPAGGEPGGPTGSGS